MAVVIDEVTAETGGERGSGAPAAAAGAGPAAEPDLDALDYRLARRRHRIRRLWAD